MPLSATTLGPSLFGAMVSLRQNRDLFRKWTGAPIEVTVHMDTADEEDKVLADTLAGVARITRVDVYGRG